MSSDPSSYIPSLYTVAKATFGGTVVLIGGALGALWYGQTAIIYPSNVPEGSRTNVATPNQYGMDYEDIVLITPDNVKITAYLMLNRGSTPDEAVDREEGLASYEETFPVDKSAERPTILILHANAGNMGHRLPLAAMFYKKMKCNVFMLSYRGYGLSEGSPSETGLRIDAQTALKYITEHPILKQTKIFLYGQSIGGAVAIDLASHFPELVHAVIVENTFLSLPRLIPTALPLLSPFTFLCNQIWDSASRVEHIPSSTPMLFLSGKKDALVPPAHMLALYELACKSGEKTEMIEKRVWWECPNGDHSMSDAFLLSVYRILGQIILAFNLATGRL